MSATERSDAAGDDRVVLAPRADAVTPTWWRNAILYENHLPSVKDGNGDGIGDLHGLIEALPYLAGTLGITAVWVGPFFRSPLLDQGFDISDYRDVEPVFGDLATFDRLIAEAHRHGVRIIVDYVPNHTSDQHPWFLASRSSREDPKRDWYVWADPAPDGGPPNNWTSEAGGSVWELDATTGQYYLHSHLKEQPDLNWRNPEVRAELLDVLRFWLDRGADGFRIDVAHMLMKDPELRDNPPNPGGLGNEYDIQHPDFASQLHVNDRRHPDLFGVLQEIRGVLDEYDGDRVAIGEIEAMPWERWAEYYGERLDALHLPFAFQVIETPWNAAALAETITGLEAHLPEGAWPILALGNHDRRRLATRIGRPQARVAAMLLLTLRGTPTILYGDELGLLDEQVPRERWRDQFALTDDNGVTRDGTRTPMPWDDSPNAGFSTAPEADLWLPISSEWETVNVQAQLRDERSSLNLYRALIALRQHSYALRAGAIVLRGADRGCLVYERVAGLERMLVALNLTGERRELALRDRGSLLLSTVARERVGEQVGGGVLVLAPDEGVVVELDEER